MKILLPDSLPLSPALPDGVTAATYAAREPIPAEHRDAEVLVVWENRQEDLETAARKMPNLRLVQGLMAGPDSLLRAGFADDVALANGVGLHDATVAEHALALLLALVRHLPEARRAQSEHRWAGEFNDVQEFDGQGPITSLIGTNVVIWGFGSIAAHLAPILAALGARVRGIARSSGPRSGFDVVADSELLSVLPGADVLVMILPSTPETAGALGRQEIEALPDHALLVNVGRGSTVDEEALMAALTQGRLAGAGLDVTAVEPLPAESPLWDAPNTIITPHVAGGRPLNAERLIVANVAALLAGEPLRNLVQR